HGDGGGELAAGNDVLAGGVDVDAVRRLGRRQEVDEIGAVGGVEDRDAVDHGRLGDAGSFVLQVVGVVRRHLGGSAVGDALLGATPVDRRDEVLVVLRGVHLEQGVGFLGVVGAEEAPIGGRTLPAV